METTWRVEVAVFNATGVGQVSLTVRDVPTDIPAGAITPADRVRLREIADLAFDQVQQWLALRQPKG